MWTTKNWWVKFGLTCLQKNNLPVLCIETFFTNPQYLINVTKTDIEGGDGLCTVICACLQKYTRQKRQQTGAQQAEEYINLRLYKVR